MRKLKSFLKLDKETKLLLLESYLYLAWGRILKIIPFAKVAPKLGVQSEETPLVSTEDERRLISKISNAIHIMSKYTFWESQCLVKAIAAMKMLEKRKVESTLYLGTARDENGELIAHAWLRCGTNYVTGSEGMERFTVVGKFAKRIEVSVHE